MSKLFIYNTLTGQKEVFTPTIEGSVSMYLCGPTVYGEPHLGHARSALVFDVIFRYLTNIGYKVKYVRNITDVGHLESSGDDKVSKKAGLMGLDPMEVAARYTNEYSHCMELLNVLKPSIEPIASGHILEQIELIKKILDHGLAYEVNGSVYFNIEKYRKQQDYGILSGQILDNLLQNNNGDTDKFSSLDFALWKKADPKHIMRWPSPWGYGFPGWHIECSAMSSKYLGKAFDIHGGGIDLKFPHHECEMAQTRAALGEDYAPKYWIHHNLITINKQKMGKSLGNAVSLKNIFGGQDKHSPMAVRLFILQAHYRSTINYSDQAIKSAEIAYRKLISGLLNLDRLQMSEEASGNTSNLDENLNELINKNCASCYEYMNDDFNTAKLIANLFGLLKHINEFINQKISITQLDPKTLSNLKNTYRLFLVDILGLDYDKDLVDKHNKILKYILDDYKQAKFEKNYAKVESIRKVLKQSGISLLDSPNGILWEYSITV
jgi:cysteinyl-tRNA synthetase